MPRTSDALLRRPGADFGGAGGTTRNASRNMKRGKASKSSNSMANERLNSPGRRPCTTRVMVASASIQTVLRGTRNDTMMRSPVRAGSAGPTSAPLSDKSTTRSAINVKSRVRTT